jgi:hypothetical protein
LLILEVTFLRIIEAFPAYAINAGRLRPVVVEDMPERLLYPLSFTEQVIQVFKPMFLGSLRFAS